MIEDLERRGINGNQYVLPNEIMTIEKFIPTPTTGITLVDTYENSAVLINNKIVVLTVGLSSDTERGSGATWCILPAEVRPAKSLIVVVRAGIAGKAGIIAQGVIYSNGNIQVHDAALNATPVTTVYFNATYVL